jgi:hypothetical protein
VAKITLDPLTGMITHLGGTKLPDAIPMQAWSEANQEYTQRCTDYIEESYKAQTKFTEAINTKILHLVKQHSGNEILERLQEEKGFNLVIVKPTEKWEEPGYEEPEAEGLVDLNNLRRVEIVAIATKLMREKVWRLRKPLTTAKKRGAAITLAAIQKECVEKLSFPTVTNTRVKGVKGSDQNHKTDNIDQFYIDAIPDILLQEGWKRYTTDDSFVPELNQHPFWEWFE